MTDNTTLKKIQYLLEDYTRLTEVSKKELTEWEDAMPFYQPLKLLLAKKNEMLGMKSTDVSSATFYNNDIDFDLYESKEGIDPLEVEEIVLEQELPVVEVVETNTSSETTEVIETIVDGDSYSKEIEKRIVELPEKALHVIDHELASDELEESLPEELAEHLDFSSITGYTSIDDYDLNEIKLNESDREKISMGILSNLKVDVVQNSTDVETEVEEETVQEYVVKKDKKVKSKKEEEEEEEESRFR